MHVKTYYSHLHYSIIYIKILKYRQPISLHVEKYINKVFRDENTTNCLKTLSIWNIISIICFSLSLILLLTIVFTGTLYKNTPRPANQLFRRCYFSFVSVQSNVVRSLCVQYLPTVPERVPNKNINNFSVLVHVSWLLIRTLIKFV